MKDEVITYETLELFEKIGEEITYTPITQSALQKYLRDKYHLHITVDVFDSDPDEDDEDQEPPTQYDFAVFDVREPVAKNEEEFNYVIPFHEHKVHKTYELALEKGLQETLKLFL